MKPFTRLFSSGVLSILSLLAPSSSSAAATTTYEVWRNSTSNDASTAQRIGDTASTSFTDRDVLPGRRYYYWGKARTSETVSGRYSNLLGAINLNLSMTVPTSAKRGAKSQINVEVDDGGIIPFVDVSGPLIVTVCEDDRFGFGLFGGVQEMSKKEEKNMRWDALTPLKKKYEFFIDIGSFEEGDANAEVFLKVLVDKSLQGPFFSFKPQAETATVNVALRDNYDPAPVIAASQGTQAGQVTLSWNATTGNSDFSLVSATGFAKSECYFLTRSVLPFGQGAIAVDSQPTPEGCYEAGKTITITAHPAAGYEFVSWSGDASGGRLATEILMDRNRAVTANFRLLSGRVIVQANPASGGSVSGDGEYQVGTRLQIAASPNSRWTFGGWSDGSKENPRDIIVALGTTTYTAIFSEIVRPPTITSQPVHRTVTAPQSATFAVEASGNPAPTYQWQRSVSGGAWGDLNNGATYSGVTTPTLTVGDTARTMSGHQFRVIASNGVNPSATSIPATLTVVDHPPGHPYENGQIVNGFQDSFNGPARDPRWVPFGTGGDLYQQANGVLHVTVRSGDPNHLLYVAPGYSSGVQEVLARIRVTDFGTGDPPRAGIGVGVDTSPAQSNRGLNLLFRDYTQDNVPGRQFKFLDDLRSWGPPGLRNVPGQTALGWQANTWYWLRVRLDPKMDGVNDLFGRVWAADGVTPEPSEWQMTWTDSSVPKLPKPLRSGYAGITGSSINGVAEFDVDYILIKAAGLPSIKVDTEVTGRPDVGLRRELYLNIVGNSVDDLRNSPKFPNRPDRTDTVNTFESWDHNEVNEFEMYGQRLSGYILPPVTGNYVFYICSDDGSELWLSSDENPSTKRLIAREPEWHPARTWTGNARQSNRENVSQPIFLTYGKRYYVEALMKEGIIGDNLGVTWRKPGDPVPENGSPPIPGEYLRQFIQTDALIITAQPVAQTAYKGDCARFTVEASGREPLRYQWRFNGNELTGATDRVLTLCDTTPTKAGAYDVIVSDQLSRRTSQSAPLRIIDLPTITGPITNVANKHKYYLLDVSSWSAAEVAAKRLGGHLATINDQVEQEWVWSQFSKFGGVNRGLWIGLYDPDEGVNSPDPETRKREFVWASGERGVSYSNWRPSEPNNYQNLGEFYVAMWPPVDADGSLWNDFPGAWTSFLGASLNGVVEVAPTNTAPSIIRINPDRVSVKPCVLSPASLCFSSQYDSNSGGMAMASIELADSEDVTGVKLVFRSDNEIAFPSGLISVSGTGSNRTISIRALKYTGEFGISVRAVDAQGLESPERVILVKVEQPPTRIIRLDSDLAFGRVQVGSSKQLPLKIYNDGNSVLTVSSINITPLTGFSVNWNGGTVAAGSFQSVVVTFTPTSKQEFNAQLTLNSDKTDGVSTKPVSGTGDTTSRTLQLGSVSGGPGSSVSVPITLVASGDENALSFSLSFQPNQASFGTVVLGSGANLGSLVINDNQAASGQIGVVVSLPVNRTFTQGTQQVATATLSLVAGVACGTVVPVRFSGAPAPKSASDVLGADLPVNFVDGNVTAVCGIEGDIAQRPNGNGSVNAADVTVLNRIVAGLEMNLTPAEYQRADCAPRSTFGNGIINVGDVTQVNRYAVGLDPQTSVAGPTGSAVGPANFRDGNGKIEKKSAGARRVSVANSSIAQGATGTAAIQMASQGNENALSFSLTFDPSKVTFSSASLGSSTPTASLVVNTNLVQNGKIGVVISLPVNQNLPAGNLELLKLTFASGDALGNTAIAFANSPAPQSASDILGNDLVCQFIDGTITVGPPPVTGTPPTISSISDQAIAKGGTTGPIAFSVADKETFPGFLTVTSSSSNTAYVPDANIVVAGNGVNRTVTVITAANQEGSTTITLTVRDSRDGQTASTTFKVSTTLANRPPVQPTNVLPVNGAKDISLMLTLTGSPFSDPDAGDVHAASQWIIRRSSDGVMVFDSQEDKVGLTSRTIFPVMAPEIGFSTSYSWQVRYKDKRGAWSEYSIPTTFTTHADPKPVILQQPQNQTLPIGASATFVVQADGSSPLTYQWHKNGAAIPGATGSTLTLAKVQPTDSGDYSVTVNNSVGEARSNSAKLEVINSPPNDDFANRTKVTSTPATLDGSNVKATNEVGEPNHAGKPATRSVWWSWTATKAGNVTISTKGSSIDTFLAVYTGNSLASLVPVASNDDDPDGGNTSRVRFRAQAGTEYQIAVDAFGGAEGTIKLSVESEVERPQLRFELSGKNLILSWPTNSTGFVIEASDSLETPSWTRVSLAPVVIGTNHSAKIAIAGTSKFYRLQRP